jgi:hypothetical protein
MDAKDLKALFADDHFWTAKPDRLKAALRLLSNMTTVDNNQVVMALTILSIMQERRLNFVERLNWVISGVLVVLTLVQVYFAMGGASAQGLFQMLLFLVALGAACIAFLQLQTHKQNELLKLIEAAPVRDARRVVVVEIEPIVKAHKDDKWWAHKPDEKEEDKETVDRREKAAATVCAAFDILATIAENDKLDRWLYRRWSGLSYRNLFVKHWAESICRMHQDLEGYLEYRRETADAYPAFTRLSADAKPYRQEGTGATGPKA